MKFRSFKKLRSSQKALRTMVLGTIAIALILWGGFFYAKKIEPNWIAIHYVPVEMPRLAPEFQGYKIVQISDIHADPWMTQERMLRLVSRINALKPDAVAITGDFVTLHADVYEPSLTAALQRLTPQDVTVGVLGNHDQWSSPEIIRRMMKQSNIIDLSNAVTTIHRQGAMLHLAGVDDIWTKNDRLDLVLEQLPPQGAAILLAHEPDFASISAASGRFDLQMSGHSHGGQVVIPFLGAPKLPLYAKQYPSGRYQVKNMVHYTNRGVGMGRPKVRFNCRPEITVFILKTVKS
ncbi:MAG TPA: metallophosphoesterase [Coleofasciculaceae cyanobacterium]